MAELAADWLGSSRCYLSAVVVITVHGAWPDAPEIKRDSSPVNKNQRPQPMLEKTFWLIFLTDHGVAGHTGQVFLFFSTK